MSNELGILVIVVLKARNLLDKHSFYKQDVFAQLTLNGVTKKTGIDVKGGQHPEWDEELRFPISLKASEATRTLQVSCWSKEPRSDDNVGTGKLDITETLQTGEFDDWVPLSIDGKTRGDLYLEMTFYAAGPAPSLSRRPSKLPPKERLTHIVARHQSHQSPSPTSPSRSPPRSPNLAHQPVSHPHRPQSSSSTGSYLAPPGSSPHTSPHSQYNTLPSVVEEPTSVNVPSVPSILKPGRPGGNSGRSSSPSSISSSIPGSQPVLPASLAPHHPQSTQYPSQPTYQNTTPSPAPSPAIQPTQPIQPIQPPPTAQPLRPSSAGSAKVQQPPAPTYSTSPSSYQPPPPAISEVSFPSFLFPTPQATVDYTPPPSNYPSPPQSNYSPPPQSNYPPPPQSNYTPHAQPSYNPPPPPAYNPPPIHHTPATPVYQQPPSFPFSPQTNPYPYGYPPPPGPDTGIGLSNPLGSAPSPYHSPPATPYQPPYNPHVPQLTHSPAPYHHGYGVPPNAAPAYTNGYRPQSAHPKPGSKGPPPPPRPSGPPQTTPVPAPPQSQPPPQPQHQPQPQPAPVVASVPVSQPQKVQSSYNPERDRNAALNSEQEAEAARRRRILEQEERDLELARKLDMELNMNEDGGARPSLDAPRMPGAW